MLTPQYSSISVLVIGDVMLDVYIDCAAERLSQEAPVPILNPTGELRGYAGGAGNVAANCASLGAEVTLIGVMGGMVDQDTPILDGCLGSIAYPCLVRDDTRMQNRKTRFVVNGRQIMRVDQEDLSAYSREIEAELISKLACIPDMDAVIISDYRKGVITPAVYAEINSQLTRIRRNKPRLFVAPKRPVQFFRDADWIVVNQAEWREYGQEWNHDSGVVVTRGEYGITYFDNGRQGPILPARRREVYDVVGAGDTVLAAFALATTAGDAVGEAMHKANCAAAVAVSHRGTYAVTIGDLREELSR